MGSLVLYPSEDLPVFNGLRGVGKIEPDVSGFSFSGPEVAKSYKTRVWTRWKSLKEEIKHL